MEICGPFKVWGYYGMYLCNCRHNYRFLYIQYMYIYNIYVSDINKYLRNFIEFGEVYNEY